jgi:hypothetical protein
MTTTAAVAARRNAGAASDDRIGAPLVRKSLSPSSAQWQGAARLALRDARRWSEALIATHGSRRLAREISNRSQRKPLDRPTFRSSMERLPRRNHVVEGTSYSATGVTHAAAFWRASRARDDLRPRFNVKSV